MWRRYSAVGAGAGLDFYHAERIVGYLYLIDFIGLQPFHYFPECF